MIKQNISIGRSDSFPFASIRINFNTQANSHICITGASGYGKSTLGTALIDTISKLHNASILVLDVTGEYSQKMKSANMEVIDIENLWLDFLNFRGMKLNEHIQEIVGIFRSVLDLAPIQESQINEIIKAIYSKQGIFAEHEESLNRIYPTMREFMEELNIRQICARSTMKSTLTSIERRLSNITRFGFDGDTPFNIEETFHTPTCIDLSGIKDNQIQNLFIELLLKEVYSKKKENCGTKFWVLIDEAQRMRQFRESYLSVLCREGRKYNIGMIVINQSLLGLERSIIQNSANMIIFRHKEPQEIEYCSKLFALSQNYKDLHEKYEDIKNLAIFKCLIHNGKNGRSKRVKIYAKHSIDIRTHSNIESPTQARIRPGYVLKVTSENNDNAMKAGLIKEEFEGLDGCKLISYIAPQTQRSTEHTFYVNELFQFFVSKAISTLRLDGPNAPDIEIYLNDKRIAVEYETGKKNLEDSKLMLIKRSDKYDEVWVVVKSCDYEKYMTISKGKIKIIKVNQIKETIK